MPNHSKKVHCVCGPFSAVLLIMWDYLLSLSLHLSAYFLMASSLATLSASDYFVRNMMICVAFLFFPLFGMIADLCVGRYKVIMTGILLCFLQWIISGMAFTVYGLIYNSQLFLSLVYVIGYFACTASFCCIKSNIIQYNTDQFIGASANELKSVIYWHLNVDIASGVFSSFLICFRNYIKYAALFSFIVSGVSVSLVLVSHSFFKHKLENVSLIKNPIKLIVRVLCYARKHKYPENRSALTYWEEEAPSRLDLGKDKYGGPFTVEEVEDVKTFFRMLPLFIAVIGFGCADENFVANIIGTEQSCLVASHILQFTTTFVIIIVYLHIIRARFHKFIPRLLILIWIGLLLAFASELSYTLLIAFSHNPHAHDPNNNNYALLLPQMLLGISYALTVPASMEFTIAQAPIYVRGLMVSLFYASIGIGYSITMITLYLFRHNAFYYYLTKSILALFPAIVFAILAKRYKYRVRENEVNIYDIAHDHYQRYIEQEDQYNKWNKDQNVFVDSI